MGILRKIIKNILPYFFVKKYQDRKTRIAMKTRISCKICDALDKERQNFVFEHHDYIRTASLALISNEIYNKNIVGNVAELGVYRGNFARIINRAFPDRKLYLFDTFEGFDERDIFTEEKMNYSTTEHRLKENNFSETNIELVLEKMVSRENCIIKKGFFPETANGINDNFVFASIDCDLYEPIYKGLHFFYERLSQGGYIMIHDYNNRNYKGTKEALLKFSKEKNVPYFPICDNMGSAVIMKG